MADNTHRGGFVRFYFPPFAQDFSHPGLVTSCLFPCGQSSEVLDIRNVAPLLQSLTSPLCLQLTEEDAAVALQAETGCRQSPSQGRGR